MKVIFLGSPPFGSAVLAALIASTHELVAVVTPPDRPRGRGRQRGTSPLAEMARDADLPLLRPERNDVGPCLADFAANAAGADLAASANRAPEVLVVASYGVILGQDVLDLAPHGALNVHASLLPRHRGASPIQHAILAGDQQTGVSVQRMVLALDRGDVLLSRELAIDPTENAGQLLERLAPLGGAAAVEALDLLDAKGAKGVGNVTDAGSATFTPQDEAAATWAPLLKKADGLLDFTAPAVRLVRQVRAMTPWPGAHLPLPSGASLGVVTARVSAELPMTKAATAEAAPGTLLADGDGRFLVATGDGVLELTTVKPAGKAAMDGAAFLRGARLKPGEVLGA
ncbi:MAG: methionyl-tRNA formyltransferase [Planctomycetota bacterium]|jgi:methionyl-tRNA formyltransferase|nr:methionyl-tRNA formyltransferase [Planctomycetota bacterium]